jgi:hypothetical protein
MTIPLPIPFASPFPEMFDDRVGDKFGFITGFVVRSRLINLFKPILASARFVPPASAPVPSCSTESGITSRLGEGDNEGDNEGDREEDEFPVLLGDSPRLRDLIDPSFCPKHKLGVRLLDGPA